MRHTTHFDTPQPLIYHLCTAIKPINIFNMRHTTCFDTPQGLIKKYYAFYAIQFLIRPTQPLSISIKLHQQIPFIYSFNIYIVNMRHTTPFDTRQPLIYHLCTSLRPIVSILCHITSYMTPLVSLKFIQTSSTYCFNTNIVNIRHTSRFDTHQPLIYHLCIG